VEEVQGKQQIKSPSYPLALHMLEFIRLEGAEEHSEEDLRAEDGHSEETVGEDEGLLVA
jgi:hypothetical protein